MVCDLGTTAGLPAYTRSTPVAVANEAGGTGSKRLLLTASDTGAVHYALVTNGATAPSASLLSAARTELAAWAAKEFS